jgi:hypothetical protein
VSIRFVSRYTFREYTFCSKVVVDVCYDDSCRPAVDPPTARAQALRAAAAQAAQQAALVARGPIVVSR